MVSFQTVVQAYTRSRRVLEAATFQRTALGFLRITLNAQNFTSPLDM
jgi:uncharacterized membrane protein affecting hemolysin expression